MTPSEIQAKVRELTREIKALRRKLPRAPSAAFKGRTRAKEKAAQRERRREETARIRQERMRLALGRCEVRTDGYPQDRCLVISPLHMHHLLGGSGRRRQKQSVENVRMLCWKHHREAHA